MTSSGTQETCFPLTKERQDFIALRYMYDSEYLLRNPENIKRRILDTIVLHRFNEHDFRHRRGDALRNRQSADSIIQELYRKIMS